MLLPVGSNTTRASISVNASSRECNSVLIALAVFHCAQYDNLSRFLAWFTQQVLSACRQIQPGCTCKNKGDPLVHNLKQLERQVHRHERQVKRLERQLWRLERQYISVRRQLVMAVRKCCKSMRGFCNDRHKSYNHKQVIKFFLLDCKLY